MTHALSEAIAPAGGFTPAIAGPDASVSRRVPNPVRSGTFRRLTAQGPWMFPGTL